MSSYNGTYNPAHYYGLPEGHVVNEQIHATPPAALPPAAAIPPTALPQCAPYTDYIPLRCAPSMDVPVTYPAQSHATSTLLPGENAPTTAVTHTAGELKMFRKRKHDEEHDVGHDKRPRADGFSMKSAMQVSLPSRAQAFGELLEGTQRNPLEIESSPEPEAKAKGPSWGPPMSAGQSGLPRDLRNAGLYVQKTDLTATKVKYYAVPGGKVPGIYTDYDVVLKQVKGYSGAKQRGFRTEDEAWAYMNEQRSFVQIAVQRQKERTEVPSYSPQPRHSGMAQPFPSSPPPPYTYAPPTTSSERSSAPAKEPVRMTDGPSQQITAPPANQQPAKALEADFVPEPEPTLSVEQQYVVDLIVSGHNVFYTGSAGCGKSTILKAFVKKLRETAADGTPGKRVRIVAPTNLAALNVNGQTTWNFAGWTPDSMKKPLDKLMAAAHGEEVWERFNSTDVLVLDEISMVENLQFERLNEVMKAGIGEKYGGGPFGGIQVVVTGDFCQLSPVKPFKYCIGCGWELIPEVKKGVKQHRCENRRCPYPVDFWEDTDKWAFRSKAWQECNFKCINLTEIHRQTDRKFISILQKIRKDGIIVPNHAKILLNHASETENAIEIYARREDVDRVNNENISRLPLQAISYKCLDFFERKPHHQDDRSLEKYGRLSDDGNGTLHQLKEHRYEVTVQLKEGMRVVLQANLDSQSGLVNGSQGSIIGFEPWDENKLPRKAEGREADGGLRGAHAKYAQHQIKAYAKQNGRQPWPIVKFDNGLTKVIYADCPCNELGNEEPFSLLSRTQIPLMAGYAITVHKSQGMTLDRVIVDLRKAFEASQLYVALSRARSLKGLKVVGLPQRHLGGANAQVKEFFEKYLNSRPSSSQTPQSSQVPQSS